MIHLVFTAAATSLFFSLVCVRLFGFAVTATVFFFFRLAVIVMLIAAATAAVFVIVMGHDDAPLVVGVDENLGIKAGTWAA